MKKIIPGILKRIPFIGKVYNTYCNQRDELLKLKKEISQYQLGWPPGHFYSPIPSLERIKIREEKIWGIVPGEIDGINLNEKKQIDLLQQLSTHYGMQPWSNEKQQHLRFFFQNDNYSYGESIILFCLIMHLKPHKFIEIGSGYSSGVFLDTNEFFFNNSISTTFIEPYPQLLSSLLKPSDQSNINIIAKDLQDVDADVFSALSEGDILLIDSTHVSKIDSDVNHILFKILPQLKSGVYIHFHDIFYPFEYPKEWVYQGRAWNECYILRAFLMYNNDFEIVLFNSFLSYFHTGVFFDEMPLCAKNPGTSIWIRKK